MRTLLIIDKDTIVSYKYIIINIIIILQKKGIKTFYYNKKYIECLNGIVGYYTEYINYDIVFIFNNRGVSIMRAIFRNRIFPPIVYVALSNSIDHQINLFPNLYKILKTRPYISTDGFPEEMIGMYEYNVFKKRRTIENNFSLSRKKECKILHVVSDNDIELRVVKSIIFSFNTLPTKFKLKIICSPKQRLLLSSYANFNTKFVANDFEVQVAGSDLVLGSECIAIESISNLKPVIIVGKYGYGGMVTKENLNGFIKSRFIGRIGGNENEIIPTKLLAQEIMNVHRVPNLDVILNECYKLFVKKINFENIENYLIRELKNIIHLYSYINSEKKFMMLSPKLASNVVIYKSNIGKYIIGKNLISKISSAIGEYEFNIIDSFNGKDSLETIYQSNQISLSKREFVSFIKTLWDEKIIFFNRIIK